MPPMRAFSPRQKYRILVAHGAVILWSAEVVPLPKFFWMTGSETKRFGILRRLDCAVRCACGCDVWAPLRDIEFDHIKEWISGGPTAVENGAPLRRQPCHAAKTAASAAVTGKVTRTRRKLRVQPPYGAHPSGQGSNHRQDRQTRSSSFKSRPLTNHKFKRCVDGRTERRAP